MDDDIDGDIVDEGDIEYHLTLPNASSKDGDLLSSPSSKPEPVIFLIGCRTCDGRELKHLVDTYERQGCVCIRYVPTKESMVDEENIEGIAFQLLQLLEDLPFEENPFIFHCLGADAIVIFSHVQIEAHRHFCGSILDLSHQHVDHTTEAESMQVAQNFVTRFITGFFGQFYNAFKALFAFPMMVHRIFFQMSPLINGGTSENISINFIESKSAHHANQQLIIAPTCSNAYSRVKKHLEHQTKLEEYNQNRSLIGKSDSASLKSFLLKLFPEEDENIYEEDEEGTS